MTGTSRAVRRRAAAAVAVVLCLSAIVAAAPVDADSHVDIEEYVVQEVRGDVAVFTLSVPDGEPATLVVDGADANRTRLDLTDADTDGRIEVTANTYLAGPNATASDVYDVSDGDSLSTDGTTNVRLPAGTYRVEAYGNGTGVQPADTVRFTLTEPGFGNATVMVAPAGRAGRFTSKAAIERARTEGWLTPATAVAAGDTVLLRLQLPGIEGGVVDAGGRDTRAFRRYLDRPDVRIAFVERYPGPSMDRQRLLLNGSSFESVVADPTNGTYYVAFGLDEIPHTHERRSPKHGDESGSFDHGLDWGEFAPRFLVGGETRLNPWETDDPLPESARYTANVTGVFSLRDHYAEPFGVERVDGTETLRPGFAAAPNQTLTGYTGFAPGSTLTVTVSNATGVERSLNATARVTRETGRPSGYVFEAALNLSDVEPGTVHLRVRSNGTVLDKYGPRPQRYRVPVHSGDAAVERVHRTLDRGAVRVERATLPDGGFVAVRTADGAFVGNSGYLDAGTHEDLRLALDGASNDSSDLRAVLVRDSDGDGNFDSDDDDRPYADSMRPVGVPVSPAEPSTESKTETEGPPDGPTTPTDSESTATGASPTPTATPHTDPATTPSETETASETLDPTATSDDGPGFGALAALLGALAFGALGVRRATSRKR